MAQINTPIEEFLRLATKYPVLDVRSPGEFVHAHIPGAYSVPLFSDEERSRIGISYRHESRESAIKIGLSSFGPRMKEMVECVEAIIKKHKHAPGDYTPGSVLVHCWRGGMRSAAVAWLLDLYGFKVYVLEGGYKRYRRWALRKVDQPYQFNVIGGYTGSGKTAVLHTLHKSGYQVLDLEGIAGHKGSAFGGLDGHQCGQEQFENGLADRLYRLTAADPDIEIFVEDESQRIGAVNLPATLFQSIRQGRQYFLDVPFEARLDYIVRDYGAYPTDALVNAIIRIKRRLGPEQAKAAVNFLIEGNIRASFGVLLRYYDKHYAKAHANRGPGAAPVTQIDCQRVEIMANTRSLIMQLMDVNAVSTNY